jgi:hypothetical protein
MEPIHPVLMRSEYLRAQLNSGISDTGPRCPPSRGEAQLAGEAQLDFKDRQIKIYARRRRDLEEHRAWLLTRVRP